MQIWLNWGLVVCGVLCIFCDVVLEKFTNADLALVGLLVMAAGILGLAFDSAGIGLLSVVLLGAVYASVHRRHPVAKQVGH